MLLTGSCAPVEPTLRSSTVVLIGFEAHFWVVQSAIDRAKHQFHMHQPKQIALSVDRWDCSYIQVHKCSHISYLVFTGHAMKITSMASSSLNASTKSNQVGLLRGRTFLSTEWPGPVLASFLVKWLNTPKVVFFKGCLILTHFLE